MSEHDVIARLDRIERTLRGDPDVREDRGLTGDVHSIQEALWGPKGHPNGLVGMQRWTLRLLVGFLVSLALAGGAIVYFQGPGA